MNIYNSFRLPLCLWYDAKSIAATALVMGYQTSGTPLPADTSTHWSEYLHANAERIGGNYFNFLYSKLI